MVQAQLVEYISSQMKLGTSKEAIRTTLAGVGWTAVDIDDSFKKSEGVPPLSTGMPTAVQPLAQQQMQAHAMPQQMPATAAAQPAAQPVHMGGVMPAQPAQPAMAKPAAMPAMAGTAPAGAAGPQVLRMSDLVSMSSSPTAQARPAAMPSSSAASMPGAMPNRKVSDVTMQASAGASAMPSASGAGSRSKPGLIIYIVGGVLILGLGGLSGYLYMQNAALGGKIGSVTGQSQSVASQIASLTSQVNALTASSTALAASTTALGAMNQELMAELSFYAVPPGTTATSTSITVNGTLGVNATKNYFLTGTYGGKVLVLNSKDPKVIAVLQPLVGSSTKLAGTLVPGTGDMTVVEVDGKTF
ncbi:MAG TPA: hypothetical protein VMT99_01515 [Candidatus Paceibacterota bacterium]|nr:hypothetical protein [Candidatus Paceibacterota bacterium]